MLKFVTATPGAGVTTAVHFPPERRARGLLVRDPTRIRVLPPHVLFVGNRCPGIGTHGVTRQHKLNPL